MNKYKTLRDCVDDMIGKTRVSELHEIEEGREVIVEGWVYTVASLGTITFIRLRDSSGIAQVIVKPGSPTKCDPSVLKNLGRESSIIVTGTIRKDKRAPGGFEILASELKVIGESPKDFPIRKGISARVLGDYRHLYLRSKRLTQILRARSELLKVFRQWFNEKGYEEVSCPSIITAAVEGGATLFELKYFDKKAYLTQSSQFYLEAAIFSLEKVFTLQPSFRAEPSKTPRHLTEYWHLEMEAAWMNLADLMKFEEEMLVEVSGMLKESMGKRSPSITQPLKAFESPFERIRYEEALQLLDKKGIRTEWGKDLGADEEKALCSMFDKPIFLSHYPIETRAFYHKPDPSDPRVVLSHDVLVGGVGEVIGGGERISDYNELVARIQRYGYDPKDYSWYTDLRKYGSVPHAGFGLGIERLLAHVMGLPNIRLAIPFPRTRARIFP